MIQKYNESYSICITCCDRDVKYLERSLICASLQTTSCEEIIVAANGLDQSFFKNYKKSIMMAGKEVPISYFAHPKRKNPGFSRNFGAGLCQTKYIMFCDVDDLSIPTRLEISKKCIEKYDLDILVHGQMFIFNPITKYQLYQNHPINVYKNLTEFVRNAFDAKTLPIFLKGFPDSASIKICNDFTIEHYELFNEKQARGQLWTAAEPHSPCAFGQLIGDIDTIMKIKWDENLSLGEDLEFLKRCVEKKVKAKHCSYPMLFHVGQQYRHYNYYRSFREQLEKSDGVKLGPWQIVDDFRQKYLQNRLDKGLPIMHDWDFEDEASET